MDWLFWWRRNESARLLRRLEDLAALAIEDAHAALRESAGQYRGNNPP